MAAYSFHSIISILLILVIAIPSSLGHRHNHKRHHHHHDREEDRREDSDMEQDLRDLCSDTRDSNRCWYIIKSELNRFDNADDWRSVVGIVIDMAREKGDEIHDKLDRWYRDSGDDRLKEKYHSCSENYKHAVDNMKSAKRKLDSDDCQNILDQVDDTVHELESCRREFDEDSFDPGHVGDRNNEFGNYVDIVKVAADRMLRDN